ncbi:TORMOZ EMBRYO DEFECTIVE-like protein, partial [Drosera capensis]
MPRLPPTLLFLLSHPPSTPLRPHSLSILPEPTPKPSCTQLLSFPASGAAALPKNIELLRLFDHQKKEADHRVRATPHPCGLVGPGWDSEVYRDWKDWVFGRDAVEVGLVRVGEECGEGDGDGVMEYSYVGRVMGVLSGMREGLRRELQLVFDVSFRRGRVCEVYGVWWDEEKRVLYMVSEGKEVRLYDLIDGGGKEGGMEAVDEENCVSYWVMIGLELCEALMGLRSGCLGLSCFALDEFGHVLIDLGEAVVTGRKISKWFWDEKLSLGIIEVQDGCDIDREVLNKDFTRVHTFRGHDSRIMALAFVDGEHPMFVSGDNGGGICLWEIDVPFKEEPSKSWSEPKDWRYSGIHALAVAPSGLFFTGSGDRLIKAWSLQDSSLAFTLEGHKSVVSTLWINDGVLYSGSWDGTVRLWSLHDYSPLATFGPDTPGTVSSVLSVRADQQTVIATYENGFMKMWSNDVLQKSMKVHDGAIFALSRENQWLFTGGWDKTIKVQEIHGDDFEIEAWPIGSIALNSVITTLLYTQGLLFVGCANRSIKGSRRDYDVG